MGRKDPEAGVLFEFNLVILYVSVNELCVHVRNIQHSQPRLGSWNWLDLKWGERTRKRDTILKATLAILFVSVNELCAHVPKEFLMWNNVQHSQLQLG